MALRQRLSPLHDGHSILGGKSYINNTRSSQRCSKYKPKTYRWLWKQSEWSYLRTWSVVSCKGGGRGLCTTNTGSLYKLGKVKNHSPLDTEEWVFGHLDFSLMSFDFWDCVTSLLCLCQVIYWCYLIHLDLYLICDIGKEKKWLKDIVLFYVCDRLLPVSELSTHGSRSPIKLESWKGVNWAKKLSRCEDSYMLLVHTFQLRINV